MEIEDKLAELEEMINCLYSAIDETSDNYYMEYIQEIIYEAKRELNSIDRVLIREKEEELKQMNNDYERSKI